MSDATTTIVGNLTADPELRYTTSGRAMCSVGVAVNRRWQVDGEWQEAVSFFDVQSWGDLAENLAESLTKGTRVLVTGRLDQRSWEDDEGTKHYRVSIIADSIGPDLRWATAEVVKNVRVEPEANEEEAPTGKRRRSPLRAAS